MDMWTSNQNKSYMCVTVHWIDDNWSIQKRIVKFVHIEGRHTGTKLSETFTELMVKWYCLHQNLEGGSQKLESS